MLNKYSNYVFYILYYRIVFLKSMMLLKTVRYFINPDDSLILELKNKDLNSKFMKQFKMLCEIKKDKILHKSVGKEA
ncbi:hypothetical protein PECL_2026 [Pediococcus claussenii ATCC BAA-344]|uniref:Uncharacterized protein n=1 Tax=Pediococcus claussenii (strain ATCC BAA-344 / DSM 14800 / JCM 18046 / KCTC 3811 / LMG 21948 / P06) TaxID=701521 RepID=G8PDU0_PEDCP|nr:hypothetical protein PECL_2026 [Pediococcus claussenii ATCC BAA-344]